MFATHGLRRRHGHATTSTLRTPQEQRSRRMGALCSVRSSAGVHPTRRVSWADDQCEDPAMVQRMLDELQPLMGDFLPTANICKAMQAKIDAEETLRTAISQHKAAGNTATTSTSRTTTTPDRRLSHRTAPAGAGRSPTTWNSRQPSKQSSITSE